MPESVDVEASPQRVDGDAFVLYEADLMNLAVVSGLMFDNNRQERADALDQLSSRLNSEWHRRERLMDARAAAEKRRAEQDAGTTVAPGIRSAVFSDVLRGYRLEGDTMLCKGCPNRQVVFYAHHDFQHAAGCAYQGADPLRPWEALAWLLEPLTRGGPHG